MAKSPSNTGQHPTFPLNSLILFRFFDIALLIVDLDSLLLDVLDTNLFDMVI